MEFVSKMNENAQVQVYVENTIQEKYVVFCTFTVRKLINGGIIDFSGFETIVIVNNFTFCISDH